MTPARILLFACLLAGCGSTPVPPTVDQVSEVAAIATAVKADPAHADKILADHGLDRARFEALLFEIAADPDKAKTYAAALK
ncbi:MAG: hypothetical protein JXB39_08960 [Deltaproteobacteria bacterium]|nr:hypothetical protein [Deltaproteobacteria bacterium]